MITNLSIVSQIKLSLLAYQNIRLTHLCACHWCINIGVSAEHICHGHQSCAEVVCLEEELLPNYVIVQIAEIDFSERNVIKEISAYMMYIRMQGKHGFNS